MPGAETGAGGLVCALVFPQKPRRIWENIFLRQEARVLEIDRIDEHKTMFPLTALSGSFQPFASSLTSCCMYVRGKAERDPCWRLKTNPLERLVFRRDLTWLGRLGIGMQNDWLCEIQVCD